jgi:hypothetical protein
MKKILFIALSAISIVVAGLLVVACTPDAANTPDAQMHKMAQHSAPEQDSAAVWEAFFADVEALNAKYASQSRMVVNPNPSLYDELTTLHQLITYADVEGAQIGWEVACNIGSAPNNLLGTTAAFSAYRSYIVYQHPDTTINDTTSTGITIRINHPNTILNLELEEHPCVVIGKRHNQLLTSMIHSNYNTEGSSSLQIFQDFLERYEELYAPISSSYKSRFLSQIRDARIPHLNANVTTANENFKNTTLTMPIASMRAYTDDYLEIVENTSLNSYDKMQMSVFASVAYYSGALWVVD